MCWLLLPNIMFMRFTHYNCKWESFVYFHYCKNITQFVLPWTVIWVIFSLWLLKVKLLWKFLCVSFSGCICPLLLGLLPAVGPLSHRMCFNPCNQTDYREVMRSGFLMSFNKCGNWGLTTWNNLLSVIAVKWERQGSNPPLPSVLHWGCLENM